jgi:hypothetical protein
MTISITVVLAGIGLLVSASRVPAITIVREGHAEAVIVVPEGDKGVGAAELRGYVEKVSGAKLKGVPACMSGHAWQRAGWWTSGDSSRKDL